MSCRSLIAEDHGDIRRLIRMTLEFEDHEIEDVEDAPSAVAAATRRPPDLVLLDVMMPGEYDGLEACRRLRADPACAGSRIVLLSARGQSADLAAGREAGADAYVVKPFSPLQLLDIIRECLASPSPTALAGSAP